MKTAVIIALILAIFLVGSVGVKTQQSADYVPGQVVVITTETMLSDEVLENILTKTSPVKPISIFKEGYGEDSKTAKKRIFVLSYPKDANVFYIAERLKKNPIVFIAEPNYVYTLQSIPNDPFFSQQWGLQKIRGQDAYDISMGNESIVIAIIDSGLDLDHPEFAGKVLPGYDFVNCPPSGCVPPCAGGEDCFLEDNDTNDYLGHGTQVTGIALAITNNSQGMASMCPNCKILPIRACYKAVDGTGRCRYLDLQQAIVYAVDNHDGPTVPINPYVTDVISIGYADSVNSTGIHWAVTTAYNTGANLVAPAGNYYINISYYPAAWSEVIGVGATNQTDQKAWFSNYGQWVDVGAPGVDIMTTDIGGGYTYANGTSLSAPFVSGLVGLMLSANPALTQEQVVEKLMNTSDPIQGHPFAGGRINAYKALFASSVDIELLNFEQSATHIVPGQTLYVEFDIKNDGPVALQDVSVLIDKDSEENNIAFSIPHMNPGETVYFNMHWSYSQNGIYNPSITADSHNDYQELNETNNAVVFQIVVG